MGSSEVRIAELESALRASEKQCDDLLTDIANLCSQGGSGMFNPNYLLKERLDSAISVGRQLRQQLCEVKVDRESFLEELQQARTAKISTERCAAELSERCKSLERDVTFYKERAVKAMAERDQEIENVRAEALRTQEQLGELSESLQLAETSNRQLEEQLSGLKAEMEQLRQQAARKQQAAGAELEAELRQLRDAVQYLEDGTQKLKTQLTEVQAEASHTHKLLKQAHKIEDQLTCQVRELQAELAASRRQRSSGSQSPKAMSPTGPSRASSAGGAAAGAEADYGMPTPTTSTAATAAGGRSPGGRLPPAAVYTLPQSPSSASSPTSPPACSPSAAASAATRATAVGSAAAVTARLSAPFAGGRTLSVASATAVTVTAAEAAVEERQEPSPSLPDIASPAPAAVEALPPVAAAPASAGTHGSDDHPRIRELEAALAQAREELGRERAVHEEEREQLQVLRTMAHDFKIKLAQATQEKVEALLKAAQLAQSVAGTAGGMGGPGLPAPSGVAAAQRQASMILERNSRDLSHSPGGSLNLHPANSAPSGAAAGGLQSSARSLWTSWLGSNGGGWYGTAATATAVAPAAASLSPPPYAPSVASEEGSEANSGGAAAAAAAAAAAHAATVEAVEGRSRRLAAQLERVRSQLAVIDRLAGHVGRCEARLRSCAALLWSSREEDAPRRWAALSDLTRLAEECAALRAEAGLTTPTSRASPPSAAAAAPPTAGPLSPDYLLPPVFPPVLVADTVVDVGALRNLRQQPYPHKQQGSHTHNHRGNGGDTAAAAVGAAMSSGEYDSSVVCTREAGGVQRRVAEVLVGVIEFGVRSLEQYNHQSALTSVMYS